MSKIAYADFTVLYKNNNNMMKKKMMPIKVNYLILYLVYCISMRTNKRIIILF